jgi:hypothetical protein
MLQIVIINLSKEEFEDTTGVIRIRKWKKDRQHNVQKKDKQRSAKHPNKTKDRVTQNPLKINLFGIFHLSLQNP